ncbi:MULTISPECIES: anthranilate phosphoribosyltransferase [Bacillus]|uniref:anthranilate phosphoribosyltransferase n=1 Tax=Bacillus TaxID=1386 RepID=UPI000532F43F|nr:MULTISPECIES: anthranilate phosphoribosyltransferase [Bacillus]AMQ68194.1 anthranilate phosphoribosyltransferase [Bacillus amyloliquefaciens UMAF6639]AQP97888.1 anthranilate phosphoribosyltransferase [Bacillus sp. 275]MCC8303183.1 anthranilate phosphoribosyltransferase [Bacillus sp. AF12]MCM3447055.1 anthranilate phosphoribosyltransferase [Bacillus velezensis]MCW8786279.1 anthranilate phosphoribosyltransferase [Bacillus velezensis]
MNKFLQSCVNGRTLKTGEAEKLMEMMMNGDMSQSEIGGILSVLAHRGETAEELAGFVKVMRARAQTSGGLADVVDTCGTGGDGISTFNISTAAAITASAAGAKVAKHGNRSVSSKSGSADVLEKLGVSIQATPESVKRSIEMKQMGFLFAPLFHSSMKHVAAARKELGFRTVFNLLGPLSNPLQVKRQVIGVYSLDKARLMASALEQFDVRHVMLVSARDGLDELSITAPTDIIELKNGERLEYSVSPEQFGFAEGSLKDIQVSSSEESALLIQNIFANEAPSSALHITALNAGAAIYTAGLANDLKEGTKTALEAIQNGDAKRQLERLKQKEEEMYA